MSTNTAGRLRRICIRPRRSELDAHAAAVLRDIHELALTHVSGVASGRLFLLQGAIAAADLEQIARELLADPITEQYSIDEDGESAGRGGPAVVEVHLKGGVMDPVAASVLAAVADMGIATAGLSAATARIYQISGVASLDELEFIARKLLFNDCIEGVYLRGFGRCDPLPDHLPVAPRRPFELRHVPMRALDAAALAKLSRDAHLFLSLEEMRVIRDHYARQQRDPTDLELETFAQTWSEHCVHKTLKSAVRYRGAAFPAASAARAIRLDERTVEVRYDNLLKETIARATHDLISGGRVDWCLSVFEDNAGIIAFDEHYGVAFKVETHNHPSAIEPYGGSATGIGGVIRDVLGCGLGAKPIANTDVFCVGRPDFPMDLLPRGVLHPRRILKGVVAGVRDYGNRMGIPTVNGAILFDDRYLGNPLVFCGCLGLIPRARIHKEPQAGDLIVVIGGRTGRDGIHGATFSSAELTDTHADEFSHAVQIGNAITEKQVLDVMLQARDHAGGCLYTATTDCGAGGLSSAIGEMGNKLGAVVDLEKVPLKYAGLRYDEIWISEAQERMVLAVPPANWDRFRALCAAEGVEATVIGAFGHGGRLWLRYAGQTVGDIDAEFLHGGIPRMTKEAAWQPNTPGPAIPSEPDDIGERLLNKLAELNTASKEWVIRQYDHEVQGASVIKPLVGPGPGPSDAAVIRPRLDSHKGIVLANGLCPQLSDLDPYWMAVAAIDEAVRNAVCVGGDPDRTAILDNFCWGNCADRQTMGALVRSCQGCYDAALAYGTPFISGKDSLNNEFALDPADARRLAGRIPLFNHRIRIPETLLISALSVIDDVSHCVTMDAKRADGDTTRFFLLALSARQWSTADIAQAAALHRAVARLIRAGLVLAAHDCGDEGWLVTLAEMAFAGGCGIEVNSTASGKKGTGPICAEHPQDRSAANWTCPLIADEPFAPVPSGYVLQIAPANVAAVQQSADRLTGVLVQPIAQSRGDGLFCCRQCDGRAVEIKLTQLAAAWRSTLNW